jgi:hypothetical protein
MEPDLEVIDAFVDGECVDRDALKRTLADPPGREYLIDVLDLRAVTAGLQAPGGVLPVAERRTWRAPLAAAALVLCMGGAYAAGRYGALAGASNSGAPTNAAAGAGRGAPAKEVVHAPAPTHVIRLDPNVNWTEMPGGN